MLVSGATASPEILSRPANASRRPCPSPPCVSPRLPSVFPSDPPPSVHPHSQCYRAPFLELGTQQGHTKQKKSFVEEGVWTDRKRRRQRSPASREGSEGATAELLCGERQWDRLAEKVTCWGEGWQCKDGGEDKGLRWGQARCRAEGLGQLWFTRVVLVSIFFN